MKLFYALLSAMVLTLALPLKAQKLPAPSATSAQMGGPRTAFDYPYVENKQAPCIYDELLEKRMQDPNYRAQMQRFEEEIRKKVAYMQANQREGEKATVYTIPVVFHIMHLGEAVGVGNNIPESQITSSVEAMNRDFRRLATDNGIAQGAGPDMEIEFCLATTDPSGNPHSSINRVNASGTANYDNIGIDEDVNGDDIKALSKWSTNNYVNIWVVREINDQGDFGNWGGGTVGYAYPVSSSSATNPNVNPIFNPGDGIVVANFGLGNDPDQSEGWRIYSNLKLNRVLTHEMGHHLNLQHPFKGATCSEGDCATEGDFVCDTPPTTLNSNCNSPACSGTQIVENYMDYTGEACADMFTAGQKARMRAVLEGFSRSSLTSSTGCSSSFANANFEADVTSVSIGENVTFTDLSTGSPAISSWSWDFGDGNTSTQQNPVHSYATGGFKTVALTVGNGSDNDTETKIDYIFVSDEASGTIGGKCDSLKNYTDTEELDLTVYQSGGQPVPGIGGSSFEGFAEGFSVDDTYVFKKFIIAINEIKDAGAPSNVTFTVYDDLANGGNLVAAGAIPFSSLTEQAYNIIEFPEPVEITTQEFYIGFEYVANGDTMSVFATQFRDNEYNSCFVKTSNGWVTFQDPANFSMAIETVPYKDLEVEIAEENEIDTLCNTTELSFLLSNPINAGQYAWTFGGGINAATENPRHTYSESGDQTVSVTVTGRCGGSGQDSYDLFVYENPDVTATVYDADCGNSNGAIKVVHSGSDDISYEWTGTSNQTDSLADVAGGEYTLVATNGPCQETYNYTVGENAVSVPTTFYIEQPKCEENNGVIAAVPNRAGNFVYYWNGSSTPDNDTLYDRGPGAYAVLVKENDCDVASEQTTLINQGVKPNVDFTVADTVELGEDVTLTSTLSAGDHTWEFSDGQADKSGLTVTVNFNQVGDVVITLTVRNADNCVASESKTVHVRQTVGIASLNAGLVKIFPNPSSGLLHIQSTSKDVKISELSIVDMLGKELLHRNVEGQSNTVDISHFKAGSYLVRIKSNQGILLQRISLMH